ncbi:MAG TPA: preprotein translocase subunit YajC [Thermoanaerobaculia bacterium]|nr:preprotein translocase subunit YajC [Thermoanaerobaculia bacterium]
MDLAMYLVIAQAPASTADMLMQFVPLLLIFVIFYFLLIRPARQRQKAVQLMLENLKRGDRVVTSGGIFGEVVAIEGSNAILRIAENVKVKVAKAAITGLEQAGEKEGTP